MDGGQGGMMMMGQLLMQNFTAVPIEQMRRFGQAPAE